MGTESRPGEGLTPAAVRVEYRELVERSPAPCFETDAQGECVYVNRAWCELTGLSAAESIGLGWMRAVVAEDLSELRHRRLPHIMAGEPYEQRYRVRRPDGAIRHLSVQTDPILVDGPSGRTLQGWLGWATDETPQHELRMAVAERDAVLAAVFEQAPSGMAVLDLDGRVLRANGVLCRWLGRDETELVGTTGDELLVCGQRDESVERMATVLAGKPLRAAQRTLLAADGRELPVWTTMAPVLGDHGEPVMVVVSFSEFGDRLEHERRLQHLAHHDPLTGLPNRRALAEWASAAPVHAALFIDLDGFKSVNDHHGHLLGDRVLTRVAERLRACVRHNDLLCRVGGDEFLVVVADPTPGAAGALEARVQQALSEPLSVDGHLLEVGATIGLAEGGSDLDELAELADMALYAAKNARRP